MQRINEKIEEYLNEGPPASWKAYKQADVLATKFHSNLKKYSADIMNKFMKIVSKVTDVEELDGIEEIVEDIQGVMWDPDDAMPVLSEIESLRETLDPDSYSSGRRR